MAVATASQMATSTYWRGPGWAASSGSSAAACGLVSWAVGATASDVSAAAASARLRDQVDHGEDHDPHDVHEVPVQPDQLHGFGLLGRQPAVQRHPEQ